VKKNLLPNQSRAIQDNCSILFPDFHILPEMNRREIHSNDIMLFGNLGD
jgi:hypothetical protein